MFTTIINAEELEPLLNQPKVVIMDCRFSLADTEFGRKAYETSHIPNAQYAHLDDDLSGPIIAGKTGRHPFPEITTFAKKLGHWGIDADTQVIAYDNSHGGIAARLWYLLKWVGHKKVAVLNGGWKCWAENNFPRNREMPSIETTTFHPKPNDTLLVDVQFMEQHVEDDALLYVDSRAAARYRGEEEPIDPVAGHIPSAISAPFAENLGVDGLFLDKAALIQRFEKLLGTQPISSTVFYCGSGVTACHNLLALEHAGFESPRLFPGSWSEWIVDENRAVATSTDT
ncbi:MAG: sulfurtransferase [Bacteroidota bacterium]